MKKKRGLVFLLTFYALFPLMLFAVLYLGWMLSLENATVVLQSAVSPDGVYRAEVVRRDPGASTNYEYMVRVAPAKLTPFAQTLLALPLSPRYIALDLHREPEKLIVGWSENRDVVIQCAGCRGAAVGGATWRNVRLEYELK